LYGEEGLLNGISVFDKNGSKLASAELNDHQTEEKCKRMVKCDLMEGEII
jgi:hypothetical protein